MMREPLWEHIKAKHIKAKHWGANDSTKWVSQILFKSEADAANLLCVLPFFLKPTAPGPIQHPRFGESYIAKT
jgi:hypothetical protein